MRAFYVDADEKSFLQLAEAANKAGFKPGSTFTKYSKEAGTVFAVYPYSNPGIIKGTYNSLGGAGSEYEYAKKWAVDGCSLLTVEAALDYFKSLEKEVQMTKFYVMVNGDEDVCTLLRAKAKAAGYRDIGIKENKRVGGLYFSDAKYLEFIDVGSTFYAKEYPKYGEKYTIEQALEALKVPEVKEPGVGDTIYVLRTGTSTCKIGEILPIIKFDGGYYQCGTGTAKWLHPGDFRYATDAEIKLYKEEEPIFIYDYDILFDDERKIFRVGCKSYTYKDTIAFIDMCREFEVDYIVIENNKIFSKDMRLVRRRLSR